MKNDSTIIICCAGMGTRLGIGSTKAVINICGKPLIIRLLELFDNFDDVRIVVGYQAEKVIDIVTNYRKDVMFVFNNDYMNTGIVDSLNKAIIAPRKYIIVIDGDLVIDSDDFYKFMSYPDECIGINISNSSNPVYVNVKNKEIISFSKHSGDYEWIGLAKIESKKLGGNSKYFYEILEPLLPLKGILEIGRAHV